MIQKRFNLSKFVAKYWLETIIGAIAVLVLLVGVVVSQKSNKDSGASVPLTALNSSAGVLAVLPGMPKITLDSVRVSGLKQKFSYKRGAKIVIPGGQPLQFTGWAVDQMAATAPSNAIIQVDEFARASAVLTDRSDVSEAYKNPEYERSGFDITVPPALLPSGTHRLAFLVEDRNRSGYYVDPLWFTVIVEAPRPLAANARELPGPTRYSLDKILTPNNQAVDVTQIPSLVTVGPNESITLEGWAIDSASNAPAGGITAVIDGGKSVAGTYGASRPDVATSFSNTALSPTGFALKIPASILSRGVHDVSLRFYTTDRSSYYLARNRIKLTVE
jgi:hypothetical protein